MYGTLEVVAAAVVVIDVVVCRYACQSTFWDLPRWGCALGYFGSDPLAQVGRVGTVSRRAGPARRSERPESPRQEAKGWEMGGNLRVHSDVEGSGFHRVARDSPVSCRQRSGARRRHGCCGALAGKERIGRRGTAVWEPRRRVVIQDGAFIPSVKSEGWYNYCCCSPIALFSSV